jgi:PAS domain-containing protein
LATGETVCDSPDVQAERATKPPTGTATAGIAGVVVGITLVLGAWLALGDAELPREIVALAILVPLGFGTCFVLLARARVATADPLESDLRRALHAASDGLVVTGPDGTMLSVDDRGAALLGQTASALVGRPRPFACTVGTATVSLDTAAGPVSFDVITVALSMGGHLHVLRRPPLPVAGKPAAPSSTSEEGAERGQTLLPP